MKITKLTAGLFLVGAMTTLGANGAVAKSVLPATSNNTVTFKADENSTTDLVDPTNPTAPVDPSKPVDPTNPPTGNKGSLTIDSVPHLDFGEKLLQGGAGDSVYNVTNENPFIQVTDKRGTGAGWTLKATASEFVSGAKKLNGATLKFTNLNKATATINNPDAKSLPTATDFILQADGQNAATTAMKAEVEQGRGTWMDIFSGTKGDNSAIQLIVPQLPDAETYTSTITWSLEDAPIA